MEIEYNFIVQTKSKAQVILVVNTTVAIFAHYANHKVIGNVMKNVDGVKFHR